MNKTKKLTQGAMLLAIVGALMVLDREFGFLFTEFIILAMPVIIIIYSTKFELRDGLILTVGLLFLVFVIGNFSAYIFVPTAILVGLVYSWGIKKDFNNRKLMISASLIYIVGEIITTLVIMPLMGIDFISSFMETFNEIDTAANGALSASLGTSLNSVMMLSMMIGIVLLGVIEGWLIHSFSIIFLRRFKIKEIPVSNILDFRMNPILAYVCFIASFGNIFLLKMDPNSVLFYVLGSITMIGSIILVYVGYLFIVIWGKVVLNKNLTFIPIVLIIFFPACVLGILILGFLYGAGPLKRYIDKKRNIVNEKSN